MSTESFPKKIAARNIPKEVIASYLPKNPIIIEAGAHIGRDTIKMKRYWPQATIYAFEPVPELFSTLIHNTKIYEGIFCYPYALSTKTGTQTFYVSSGRSTATSSLFEPSGYLQEHPQTTFTATPVKTITLDQWAQRSSVMHVDFLWFDLQGGELAALQGAQNLLKTVSVIYTEVSLVERYKNTPLYVEVKQWLTEQGFSVAYEALEHPAWGNVLFIRSELI